MVKCSKCNIEKPVDDFYKNHRMKQGHELQCKACKNAYARKYRLDNKSKIIEERARFKEKYLKETGGYAVYYLPEEHYIGFTNNVRGRMYKHSQKRRITVGYEIIGVYECPIQAHLTETLFHLMGYNGFQHNYL